MTATALSDARIRTKVPLWNDGREPFFQTRHDKQDVDILGFAIFWEYLHPITESNINIVSLLLDDSKASIDLTTGLDVYRTKSVVNDLPISVVDLTDDPPLAITVDELGIFLAIYDKTVYDSLKEDKSLRRSTMEISVIDNKTCPVYERFEVIPRSIVITYEGSVMAITDQDEFSQLYISGKFDLVAHDLMFPAPMPCAVLYETSYAVESRPKKKESYASSQWKQAELLEDGRQRWMENYTPRVYTPHVPSKATCAYDSTEDFLSRILGVKLAASDRSWYIGQDRVVSSGLPQECTISVLNELVEPYGIEIAHVWIHHIMALSQDMIDWADANGREDELYRMAKEAGKLELLPENLRNPRFHVGVDPVRPCIQMAKFDSAGGGGHASFLAPRDGLSADWVMAISYRRK